MSHKATNKTFWVVSAHKATPQPATKNELVKASVSSFFFFFIKGVATCLRGHDLVCFINMIPST